MKKLHLIRKAIGNEKYSDRTIALKMGVAMRYRPQRHYPKVIDRGWFKFISYLSLYFVNILYFIRSVISFRKSKEELKELFVISSNKAATIFSEAPRQQKLSMKDKNYYAYLSLGQKFYVLCLAQLILLRSFTRIKDVYYYHDLFDLLTFDKLLNSHKINRIHFTNHYDRWAVLIDDARIKVKNQYQHGVINEKYTPPVKLTSISSVTCINERSIILWKRNICSNKTCSYTIKSLSLEFTTEPEGKSILLISNPLFQQDEIKLITYYKKLGTDTVLYYKPHPVYKYDLELLQNYVHIVNSDDYPKCTVCITKGSTLGEEYAANGVEVIWWEKNSCHKEVIKKALAKTVKSLCNTN